MRSAVVFYSLDGNTRSAAEMLAQDLGAELFEVHTAKPYPKRGLAKMLVGGRDATFGREPAIQELDMDPSAYDLVVLALPVWAGKAAAPINSFLKGRSFGQARVALVVASASGDASGCTRDLAGKLGRAEANLPTLSLRNPKAMDKGALSDEVAGFARRLREPSGGGGAF